MVYPKLTHSLRTDVFAGQFQRLLLGFLLYLISLNDLLIVLSSNISLSFENASLFSADYHSNGLAMSGHFCGKQIFNPDVNW